MSAEDDRHVTCPRCGSADVETAVKIDLAFGEEVHYRACQNCGNEFDHGIPTADEPSDDPRQ